MTAEKHSGKAISNFMKHHFRHFNAAVVIDAAEAYVKHLSSGGKMLITLAGAMSTAELGLSLAEMIRQDKVHGICCTGANLEEDVYNLVAHDHYRRVPHYRHLTPDQEVELLEHHLNRVTDTCIPEEEAMRRIERVVIEEWYAADRAGQRFFPHEFLFKVLKSGKLKQYYQIDPKDSWMLAAAEKNLPMIVPGWEDSTLGNMFAAQVISGKVKNADHRTRRRGVHDRTGALVHGNGHGHAARFLPDWRRHRRRFSHLRGPHASPGSAPRKRSPVGLFLPDQRFHHQLRLLFRRRAQ